MLIKTLSWTFGPVTRLLASIASPMEISRTFGVRFRDRLGVAGFQKSGDVTRLACGLKGADHAIVSHTIPLLLKLVSQIRE